MSNSFAEASLVGTRVRLGLPKLCAPGEPTAYFLWGGVDESLAMRRLRVDLFVLPLEELTTATLVGKP